MTTATAEIKLINLSPDFQNAARQIADVSVGVLKAEHGVTPFAIGVPTAILNFLTDRLTQRFFAISGNNGPVDLGDDGIDHRTALMKEALQEQGRAQGVSLCFPHN